MIQKLRFFLILPLFFYSCGVMESEYKPDIAIEIEHNLPVIDGVPTLTLNQNMWQNIHYIDFKVTLDGRPANILLLVLIVIFFGSLEIQIAMERKTV